MALSGVPLRLRRSAIVLCITLALVYYLHDVLSIPWWSFGRVGSSNDGRRDVRAETRALYRSLREYRLATADGAAAMPGQQIPPTTLNPFLGHSDDVVRPFSISPSGGGEPDRANAVIYVLARNSDLVGLEQSLTSFEQRFNREYR